jgi:hypothetical protein
MLINGRGGNNKCHWILENWRITRRWPQAAHRGFEGIAAPGFSATVFESNLDGAHTLTGPHALLAVGPAGFVGILNIPQRIWILAVGSPLSFAFSNELPGALFLR